MSAYFSTANASNYLQYDAGSESSFSYPFTIAVWFKHGSLTAAACPFSVADDNGGAASNRYSAVYTDYISASMRYALTHRSETFTGYSTGSGTGPSADTWTAMVLVCTSATSRRLYYGTSSAAYSSVERTDDSGSLLSIQYATIGALWRAAASVSYPFVGYVARAARWTTGLSQTEVEDYLDGTEPTSIQSGSLWGYWKLNGSSLTDSSGNGRTLTEVGTVGDSTDEPFADTTKYLKLLASASAQSDTGVSGVVFDGTGYTTSDYLGTFSGASFEASLESGSAVLKVPVADFGGSALTTSSTPVAFIWNSTDAGIGPADCTVIEE